MQCVKNFVSQDDKAYYLTLVEQKFKAYFHFEIKQFHCHYWCIFGYQWHDKLMVSNTPHILDVKLFNFTIDHRSQIVIDLVMIR